jgi:hypothetical protein
MPSTHTSAARLSALCFLVALGSASSCAAPRPPSHDTAGLHAAPRVEARIKAAAVDHALDMDRQTAVDGDGHELLVILADEDSAAVADLLPAWHLTAQDPVTVPDGALHQREATGTRRVVR